MNKDDGSFEMDDWERDNALRAKLLTRLQAESDELIEPELQTHESSPSTDEKVVKLSEVAPTKATSPRLISAPPFNASLEPSESYSFNCLDLDFDNHPLWHGVRKHQGRSVILAKGRNIPDMHAWPIHAIDRNADSSEKARADLILNGIGRHIWSYCGRYTQRERLTDPLAGYCDYFTADEFFDMVYGAVVQYELNGTIHTELLTFQLWPIPFHLWFASKKAFTEGVKLEQVGWRADETLDFAESEFGADLTESRRAIAEDPMRVCLESFELSTRELLWPFGFSHQVLLGVARGE